MPQVLETEHVSSNQLPETLRKTKMKTLTRKSSILPAVAAATTIALLVWVAILGAHYALAAVLSALQHIWS